MLTIVGFNILMGCLQFKNKLMYMKLLLSVIWEEEREGHE